MEALPDLTGVYESSDSSDSGNSAERCIHVSSKEIGKVIPFQEKSWTKIVGCCLRWAKIADSLEGDAAKNFAKKCGIHVITSIPVCFSSERKKSAGYHRGCYLKFCHVGKLQRAESRYLHNTIIYIK